MKKNQLSESFKALFLSFVAMISFAGNALAQVTVSEPDDNGVVTITTTEAGQIGVAYQENQWSQVTYKFSSNLDADQIDAIKVAEGLKFVGYVNDADMKALFCARLNNNVATWTKLDMGKAEFEGALYSRQNEWEQYTSAFTTASWYKISSPSFVFPKATASNNKITEAFVSSTFINLTDVTIPEGYTEIGDKAFYGCI